MKEKQKNEKDTIKKDASWMNRDSIEKNLSLNREYFDKALAVNMNFDMIAREIEIGEKRAMIYFVDGFCKDEMMQKIMQYWMGITKEELAEDIQRIPMKNVPYVEVTLEREKEKLITAVLSGQMILLIDGYDQAVVIDSRTYPARSVEEPDKDKALRGSKDGFVETVIFNTALIRRRIRDTDLYVEVVSAGKASKTDIAICYMHSRVDQKMLKSIRDKIKGLQVDALTMNQQSLAECLFHRKWINPFPKFRYTERPDTAAAQILEGNIILLVDNSPQAMVLPTSLFDIIEEADDYYFPPITGTYLRLAKYVIGIFSFFVTPLYLLFVKNPSFLPKWLSFILLKENANVPVFWQFIILELALDGLRLAAVNTPSMLSTPLSIMAALILGDFSVSSGWFNAEVMLYMAFVAIANYTQTNYELAYAIKFMRIITLILTQLFGIYGFVFGVLFCIVCMAKNHMVCGNGYMYPLIPFNANHLYMRLVRRNIKNVSKQPKEQ